METSPFCGSGRSPHLDTARGRERVIIINVIFGVHVDIRECIDGR